MLIAGLQKSSLLDYPEKIAAVVFTCGCNFRCDYCHNPDILTDFRSDAACDEQHMLDFLNSRKGKLDAVVVSGGEPTLQKDLPEFFKKIKSRGFLTKLDTNGTNPDVVKKLVHKGLVDYIAMDIKAPVEKYHLITNTCTDIEKIKESIDFIMNCGVDYEFRTTVVKSSLDEKDLENIGKTIKGAKRYYLQKFVATKTLNPAFAFETTYSTQEFEHIKSLLLPCVKEVFVR